jgi:hypothetical protein
LADKKMVENEELGSKLKAEVLQEMGRNLTLFAAYNEGEKDELLRRA